MRLNSALETECTGLHWLASSWCHIPVRLLDYTEDCGEPVLCLNIRVKISSQHTQRPNWSTNKQRDADAGTCALVLSIPGVWRVNLQCGRAVSACIRAHTGLFRLSPSSRPPLTNLTQFSGLHHRRLHRHTLKKIHCHRRLCASHETTSWMKAIEMAGIKMTDELLRFNFCPSVVYL